MKLLAGRITVLAALLAVLLMISAAASAADNPVRVTMELSRTLFEGPGKVYITITVTNTGDADLPGTAAMYYPDGRKIEEFGTPKLKAHETFSWSGEWDVTEQQILEERITFRLTYATYGDIKEGNTSPEIIRRAKNFSKRIKAGNPETEDISLKVTAEADRETVYLFPAKVRFTVTVSNEDYAEVQDITVKKAGVTVHTFKSIPAYRSSSFVIEEEAGAEGNYLFTATCKDRQGKEISFDSNTVRITHDPSPVQMQASFDRTEVDSLPATVQVTARIRNNTDGPLKDVSLLAGKTVLYTFPTLDAGENAAVIKDLPITMEGEYRISAAVANEKGNLTEACSTVMTVSVSEEEKQKADSMSRWPKPKAEGWDLSDLAGFPLPDQKTLPMPRSTLMSGGLLLVNASNPRPDDFDEEGPVSVAKYYTEEDRIMARDSSVRLFPNVIRALRRMLDAAGEAGMEHYIVEEGFRTYEEQEGCFNHVKEGLSAQYSGDALTEETKKQVRFPGTSEYNTGLAFELRLYDRNDPDIGLPAFSSTDQARWINENCWKYGFVFRFPQEGWPLETSTDKSKWTGVTAKINVYRYVGNAHAAVMHYLDLCLEEYIGYLQEHPHIALYEDGVLKYEVFRQEAGTEDPVPVPLTLVTNSFQCSLDNTGAVISAFSY